MWTKNRTEPDFQTLVPSPRTHALLSLVSSALNITSQELKTADGHPLSLITLHSYSVAIFEDFHQCSDELYVAIKALQKGVHLGMVAKLKVAQTTTAGAIAETPERKRLRRLYFSRF